MNPAPGPGFRNFRPLRPHSPQAADWSSPENCLIPKSPERPQPFDANRAGLILGEGAGVFVLETEAHAVRRDATLLAEIGGYGVACDGLHITRPSLACPCSSSCPLLGALGRRTT